MKQNLLSGVKPTNKLTIGNYLGALKPWVKLQSEYNCYFPVMDLHSITVSYSPEKLRENTLFVLASYIAAGIDPEKCCLFLQSQVSQHAVLSWLLNCNSNMGELSRMTQFKDKKEKAGKHIPAGLFTYPILMSADILLYDTHIVPVGDDQKQHVELTRDIAERVNQKYGEGTFVVPKPVIPKVGARIMDLQKPTHKMGKSDSEENGAIYLSDTKKQIEKKVKRAVTDSGTQVEYNDEKLGIKNLIDLQTAITGKTHEEIVASYEGKLYGHLKVDTANIILEELMPVKDRMDELLNDRGELERILKYGREKASTVAQKTLNRVFDRLGFVLPV
jgi:tryptophanyl-tRNA synthetase